MRKFQQSFTAMSLLLLMSAMICIDVNATSSSSPKSIAFKQEVKNNDDCVNLKIEQRTFYLRRRNFSTDDNTSEDDNGDDEDYDDDYSDDYVEEIDQEETKSNTYAYPGPLKKVPGKNALPARGERNGGSSAANVQGNEDESDGTPYHKSENTEQEQDDQVYYMSYSSSSKTTQEYQESSNDDDSEEAVEGVERNNRYYNILTDDDNVEEEYETNFKDTINDKLPGWIEVTGDQLLYIALAIVALLIGIFIYICYYRESQWKELNDDHLRSDLMKNEMGVSAWS